MPFVSERFIKVREEKKDAATTGNDLFLNPSGLSDGQTVRFSPVGGVSLDFYEIWGRTSEGKPKCLRFSEEPTPKELQQRAEDEGLQLIDNKGNPSKLKQALAFWIWNYGTESVQLFQASQATILDTFGSLFSDPDVAENPDGWDFELNRTGTTFETTRYTVVLKPGRRKGAVASQVNDAWEECRKAGYNLEALLTGGDPTKMPF